MRALLLIFALLPSFFRVSADDVPVIKTVFFTMFLCSQPAALLRGKKLIHPARPRNPAHFVAARESRAMMAGMSAGKGADIAGQSTAE